MFKIKTRKFRGMRRTYRTPQWRGVPHNADIGLFTNPSGKRTKRRHPCYAVILRFGTAAGRAETRPPAVGSDSRRVFIVRRPDARPRDKGEIL